MNEQPPKQNTSPQKQPQSTAEMLPEAGQNDGLEILLNMAKTGQIDPWNIDIVKVADEYLRAVADLKEEAQNEEKAKSTGLKITGKIILYLAILLRMKSDQLAGIDYLDPPQEEFADDMDGDIELADGNRQKLLPYNSLDEFIERRTSTKERRIRKVTLKDLIVELKRYEELEAKRSLRIKLEKDDDRRMQDYSHLTSDDIEELAHEEFIEDTILRLMDILERLFLDEEAISLSQLMEEGQIDKVSAFLALLFLSARGQVNMHQDEFYSELYVSYDNDDDLIPNDMNDNDEAPDLMEAS